MRTDCSDFFDKRSLELRDLTWMNSGQTSKIVLAITRTIRLLDLLPELVRVLAEDRGVYAWSHEILTYFVDAIEGILY
ncbi:hypothetical protein ACH5RR_015555, partial [Cinchona calisaya]